MPGGRPTKYKPEYCETVIELGKEGAILEQMASYFDVTITTLYEWTSVHPEFSTAFARAKTHSMAFFASKIAKNLENRDFNAKAAEYFGRAFHRTKEAHEAATKAVNIQDAKEQCTAIINACLAGEVSADFAERLVRSICAKEGLKLDDIEKRIEQLHSQIGNIS